MEHWPSLYTTLQLPCARPLMWVFWVPSTAPEQLPDMWKSTLPGKPDR